MAPKEEMTIREPEKESSLLGETKEPQALKSKTPGP